MANLVPGDLVRYDGQERVVVDVSPFPDDPTLDRVVLRPANDQAGELTAAHPDACELIRHLDEIEGWVQVERGVWRKT
jgi:hypothetical protein